MLDNISRNIKSLSYEEARDEVNFLLEEHPYDLELDDIYKCDIGVKITDYYSIRNNEAIIDAVGIDMMQGTNSLDATENNNSQKSSNHQPTPTPNVNDINDDYILFSREWRPTKRAVIAKVLIFHSLGEHILRFNHVFNQWAASGILVHGFDQRGYGRSGACVKNEKKGGRGGAWNISTTFNDADTFVYGHRMQITYSDRCSVVVDVEDYAPAPFVDDEFKGLDDDMVKPSRIVPLEPLYDGKTPFFVFGHSTGGTLALLYSQTRSQLVTEKNIPPQFRSMYRHTGRVVDIKGVIPCAINIKYAKNAGPNWTVRNAIKYGTKLFPRTIMDCPVDGGKLSKNLINDLFYMSDTLVYNKCNLEYLSNMSQATDWLISEGEELGKLAANSSKSHIINGLSEMMEKVNVFVVLAADDIMCDNKVSLAFSRNVVKYLTSGAKSLDGEGNLIRESSGRVSTLSTSVDESQPSTRQSSMVRPRGAIRPLNKSKLQGLESPPPSPLMKVHRAEGSDESSNSDNNYTKQKDESYASDDSTLKDYFNGNHGATGLLTTPSSPTLAHADSCVLSSGLHDSATNKWRIHFVKKAGNHVLHEERNLRDATIQKICSWIIEQSK